jgi:Fe-S cluster assembly protein SufB
MDTTNSKSKQKDNLNFDYKFGFSMPDKSVYKTKRGLNEDIVCEISKIKAEPQWMTDFRIKSYETFKEKPMPTWGGDLSGIKFDDIVYYSRSSEKQTQSWEDLPTEIKQTYDKIINIKSEKRAQMDQGTGFVLFLLIVFVVGAFYLGGTDDGSCDRD